MSTAQEEISRYFKVCGFAPDDFVSVVWKARSGALGWTNVLVSEAWKPIVGHQLVDCWISANPMNPAADKESRGTADDVYAVRALWADLDVGPGKLADFATARAVIAEVSELIGAQPVVLVASGHGLQPRWRLAQLGWDEGFDRPSAAEILERFGRLVQVVATRHGGKADSVYDLPRIIRAPGTMNCKDGATKGIPVRVKFTGSTDAATWASVLDAVEKYVPVEKSAEPTPKEENVDLSRGDRYVEAVVKAIQDELVAIEGWPTGKTDDRGRGWEKIQADAAYRLAELAKADWNSLSETLAKAAFTSHAPTDAGWTQRDVVKKWNAQWKRAEPAQPPAVVDDPLAPGYTGGADAPPLPGAPADIWSAGVEDHLAGVGAADAGREGRVSAGAGGRLGDGADARGGQAPGRRPADDGVVPAPAAGGTPPVADGGDPAGAAVPWRKRPWTDRGNAERVIDLYGDTLRWGTDVKRWLRYEGGAWREDETGGESAALDMIDQLPALEAGLYSDVDVPLGRGKVSNERADFLKWVREQQAAAKYTAAAKAIRFTQRLNVSSRDFDVEPMLLNVANGIIDLADGTLLPHDPSLLLSRQLGIEYDPHAKAPRWEAFLERVMPSVDMRDYLQRIVGYTLTGETSEQVVFFHVGPPATGKTVFLEVLIGLLGDFAGMIPSNTLLNKKMEQHPADIMSMAGRRLLGLDETPEGARLDEALVKRLSGESTLTARGMGENWRTFSMVGKVHLVTNHDPHISDDAAVHRRLHYVPWTVRIPEEERIAGLARKIVAEEGPGVLAWAVRGTARWLQDRLKRPVEAEMARSAYIAGEDEFAVFIEEELIVGAESFTSSKEVFRRYTQWCDTLRLKPMSSVALGRKLAARGIEATRTSSTRGFKVALTAHAWVPPDPLA